MIDCLAITFANRNEKMYKPVKEKFRSNSEIAFSCWTRPFFAEIKQRLH